MDITRVLFPGEPYGLNPAEYTMPQMFHDAGDVYKRQLYGYPPQQASGA